MDLEKTAQALERAFARDIEVGTVEGRQEEGSAVADGGNWRLTASTDGTLALDLPMNEANYYDEDTDAFIENVIGTEAEESLAVADRELGGALVAGLREGGDVWSIRLGERLAQAQIA